MKGIFRDLLDDLREFEGSPAAVGYDLRLDLADLILRHLAEKGWTQKQLAEAAGMKAPSLTRIIHATTNCTFDTAGRILAALGVRAKLVVHNDSFTVPAAKGTARRGGRHRQ